MKISKKQVLDINEYIKSNPNFYFSFQIICTDFSENDELFDVDCLELEDSYINDNKDMKDFILVENLQNLNKETLTLMSKGFLEKIENTNAITRIEKLAFEYRKEWKEELCESENIEAYGLNEFLGGKAEGYEDCLDILK